MAVNYIDYILHFENVDKSSLPLVGGKNASLGEMIKAGIRVPTGFAVTTNAYLDFVTEAGLTERIMEVLCDVNPNDIKSLDQASSEVQALVNDAMMNVETERAIEEGYSFLCDRCGAEKLPVAVRSSATAEDLPTASFAGLQDTYLWVQGIEQVIKNVQKCWASLFTSRAISYRIRNGFTHEKVLISVGVQKMVNSRVAGVMFTINPTDGDPSKVVIEGNWGLGETVVGGTVNPDKFVVDKVVMETNEKTISAKHIKCVYDPDKGEVVNIDVEQDMQSKCCLDDREIKELAKIAKEIERHYGRAMDIEWAIDKDSSFPENVFIVQARPETVWSQRKKESVLGKKSGYQLLMEQAMKRIKIAG
ncbi:MAG: phenylphosphate synthase subunit beta [Desulfobacteraceae bacterium]|nr:phenylphosphate synthase subunit beta [Desulfobacteraceae bacterium]